MGVHHLRAMRASYNIAHKTQTETLVNCKGDAATALVTKYSQTIRELGSAKSLEFTSEDVIKGCSVDIVNPDFSVFINLQGVVDIDAEIRKLEGMLKGLNKALTTLEERVASPLYQNTPAEKQTADKQKLEDLKTKISTGEKALAGLK